MKGLLKSRIGSDDWEDERPRLSDLDAEEYDLARCTRSDIGVSEMDCKPGLHSSSGSLDSSLLH